MRRAIPVVVVATSVLAILSVAAIVTLDRASADSTVNVELGNLWFCDPSYQEGVCETTVTTGDTVVWENTAGLHTVTECTADFSICPPEGGFDSGFFNADETYSFTFGSAGTYTYWCTLHPIEMRGRIIVQAPTPTPSPTPAPTAEPTPTPVGQTPSPTPVATATPGAVPGTGGPPRELPAQSLPLGVLIAGIVCAVLGAGAMIRLATARH